MGQVGLLDPLVGVPSGHSGLLDPIVEGPGGREVSPEGNIRIGWGRGIPFTSKYLVIKNFRLGGSAVGFRGLKATTLWPWVSGWGLHGGVGLTKMLKAATF